MDQAGIIITAIVSVLTAGSVLVGGVWWLASLHSTAKSNSGQLGTVCKDIKEMKGKVSHAVDGLSSTLVEVNQSMRDHAADCDRHRAELERSRDDHEIRLRTLEAG